MKLSFYTFCLGMLLSFSILAQTTIVDFESESTTVTFSYFGSTLDQTPANNIANPDASGINTSAMVGEHIKPANSQTWAGAAADVTVPINVIAGNNVCMKVWFPNTGSVSLKLEEGGDAPNWINTQSVDVANTWVEVCFDTKESSFEDPLEPAAGGVFNRVALFFDFGTSFDADQTYYFDDIIVGEGQADPIDVTFNVDVTGLTPSDVMVTVNGTSNAMMDDDGDNIYSYTATGVQPGNFEYLFSVDGSPETFEGFFTCLNDDGNRSTTAVETTSLPPVVLGSCFVAGEGVKVSIELGDAGIAVDSAGLFIAGGGNFGVPGDFPLSDEDGDGVHTAVFEFAKGFSSFYTFTNGACGDFGCKEQIGGLDCSDPDNFNDRFFGPVTQDTTISTCFQQCTTSALECEATSYDVTFQVDMNNYTDPINTAVYVSGTFNNWSGDANPMQDDDGDGIWETTITVIPGQIEYKFTIDNWAVQEDFMEGASCTISAGGFTNRVLEVTQNETVCFLFNSCDACAVETVTVTFEIGQADIELSPEGLFIAGGGNFGVPGDFPLTDEDGDGIHTMTIELEKGFSSFYTIANGACADFSCKENIAGQDCSDPNNFNDRFFGPISQDTVISTCFGQCTTSAMECASANIEVTFQVDMTNYTESFNMVYLSGTFNNWSADANPMQDDDQDNVWETTLTLLPGAIEYKFQLDMWAVQDEFTAGDPCTVTNGGFTNRSLDVAQTETVCFEFNTCNSCTTTSVRNLAIDNNLFQLNPNITNSNALLTLSKQINEVKTVRLFNVNGQLIQQYLLGITDIQQEIDLSNLPKGLYLVTVQTATTLGTRKLIKQ